MPVQKPERNPHHGVGVALLFLTILTSTAGAQTTSPPNPPADPPSALSSAPQEDKSSDATPKPATAKPLSEKEARRAQIAADTDRLYQLAQELKAEVAKSNKDTLSLSVIKKATEVEKLAKSLKDRMKTD